MFGVQGYRHHIVTVYYTLGTHIDDSKQRGVVTTTAVRSLSG